jgi:hypothetical protein
MHKRLDQLISRAKAKTLWQHRGRYQIAAPSCKDLHVLVTYLTDRSNPLSMSIVHFIKRAPIGCSYSDASTGCGMGFCSPMHKFYRVSVWSDDLRPAVQFISRTTRWPSRSINWKWWPT